MIMNTEETIIQEEVNRMRQERMDNLNLVWFNDDWFMRDVIDAYRRTHGEEDDE